MSNHPLPARPTALTNAQASTSRAAGLSLPRPPFVIAPPGASPHFSPKQPNSPALKPNERPIDPSSLPWRRTIDPAALDPNFDQIPLREGWQFHWRRWESTPPLSMDDPTSSSLSSTSKSTPVLSGKRSRQTAFDDPTDAQASSPALDPTTSTLASHQLTTNLKSQLHNKSIHSDSIELANRSVFETARILGGSLSLFGHVTFVAPAAQDLKGKGKEKESDHELGKRELWVFALINGAAEGEMEVDDLVLESEARKRLDSFEFPDLTGSSFLPYSLSSLTPCYCRTGSWITHASSILPCPLFRFDIRISGISLRHFLPLRSRIIDRDQREVRDVRDLSSFPLRRKAGNHSRNDRATKFRSITPHSTRRLSPLSPHLLDAHFRIRWISSGRRGDSGFVPTLAATRWDPPPAVRHRGSAQGLPQLVVGQSDITSRPRALRNIGNIRARISREQESDGEGYRAGGEDVFELEYCAARNGIGAGGGRELDRVSDREGRREKCRGRCGGDLAMEFLPSRWCTIAAGKDTRFDTAADLSLGTTSLPILFPRFALSLHPLSPSTLLPRSSFVPSLSDDVSRTDYFDGGTSWNDDH